MANVLDLSLWYLTAYSVAVSAWAAGVESQVETPQQDRDVYSSVPDLKEFFSDTTNIAYIAGGGGGGLLVLLIALITGVCCCCCFCYKKKKCCFKPKGFERRALLDNSYQSPDAQYTNGGQVRVKGGRRYEKTVGEEFRRQRDEQEQSDRALAKKIILFHLRSEKRLELTRDLPDMGSRMLKFWFKIHDQASDKEQLLTIAPVSQKCPLNLDDKTIKTINSLLIKLSHPNLHRVLDVSCVSKDHMVLIRQPFVRGGSLKDAIYKSDPISEWTMKYSRRCRGLSGAKVALYGRQILDGLVYLYDHHFPSLGHIQTGNVFMDGDTCRLGGYENALLGYKTRAYKLCKEHLEDIDLILFGHVVFEMSCGYEMTELVPGERQYIDVKDKRVLQIMRFIFQTTEEGNFAHNIREVLAQQFFQDAHPPIQRGGRADHTELSGDMTALLVKVKKNKPRAQKHRKKRSSRPKLDRGMGSPSSPSDADSGPQSKLS